jgi:hypothetical protein
MEKRILPSTLDDRVAMEKGRLHVAHTLANDPDQRKLAEDRFEAVGLGRDYLRKHYPEAYQRTPFFRNLIDRIRFR